LQRKEKVSSVTSVQKNRREVAVCKNISKIIPETKRDSDLRVEDENSVIVPETCDPDDWESPSHCSPESLSVSCNSSTETHDETTLTTIQKEPTDLEHQKGEIEKEESLWLSPVSNLLHNVLPTDTPRQSRKETDDTGLSPVVGFKKPRIQRGSNKNCLLSKNANLTTPSKNSTKTNRPRHIEGHLGVENSLRPSVAVDLTTSPALFDDDDLDDDVTQIPLDLDVKYFSKSSKGNLLTDDITQVPASDDITQVPAPNDIIQVPAPDDITQVSAPDDITQVPAPDDVTQGIIDDTTQCSIADNQPNGKVVTKPSKVRESFSTSSRYIHC